MSGSALLGQPPISVNDKLIFKSLQEISPSLIELLPLLAENGNDDTWATSIIIGSSLAIAIVTTITMTRIGIRWSRLGTLGADDIVIIPACLGCVAYMGIIIASATMGCVGRHVYTCTYKEMGIFFEVSNPNCYSLLLYPTLSSFQITSETHSMATRTKHP